MSEPPLEEIKVSCFCGKRNPSCQLCGGTGQQTKHACVRCKGEGYIYGTLCQDCRGRRYIEPVVIDGT